MKKEEIYWGDWQRILFGNAPEIFLLEVLIRTLIIYLILIVVLRLMGKRMGGQLTISELAVMLTLGAIVSVAMQLPEKGLLQSILVLICALVFQRGITFIGSMSSNAEHVLQGKESMLVKDGVILIRELKKTRISKEQLFAVLRNQNIYSIGQVERIYLEAGGMFSIFKFKEPRPGLSIFPPVDAGLHHLLPEDDQYKVCRICGKPARKNENADDRCSHCNNNEWQPAVL